MLRQALYQLHRGPMLGGMRGHSDERALLHAAFLGAPPPLAARMLLPALFLLDAGAGRFQEVAPADTALLPGEPPALVM